MRAHVMGSSFRALIWVWGAKLYRVMAPVRAIAHARHMGFSLPVQKVGVRAIQATLGAVLGRFVAALPLSLGQC